MIDKKLRIAAIGTKGKAMRVAILTIQLSDNALFVGLIGSNFLGTQAAAANYGVRAF